MKNTTLRIFTVGVLAAALLAPLAASAQTTASASSTRLSAAEAKAKAKADTEIGNRTDALQQLLTRVGQMKKVSSDFVQAITASVQAEISQLADLKTKIDADTDSATLKTDMQSITKSYRIYALILPQSRIAAMSDRVQTIVGMMQTESQKIAGRLATLPGDTTSLQATLSDYNAKVADAATQAQNALSGTENLKPDNGDQTIFASNQTALKAARTALQAAQQDLVAARKDLKSLIQGIKAAGPASTTPQQLQ